MTAHRIFLVAAFVGMLLGALRVAAGQATPSADQPIFSTVFEKADFLLSEERRPPGVSAAWQSVSLPDQWRHRMPQEVRGQGWYRVNFRLADNPTTAYAIHIPHVRALRIDYFVNGKQVGGAGDVIAGHRATHAIRAPTFVTPLSITVPPGLLRSGENSIHIRVRAASDSTLMHGLPRVTLGEATGLRNAYLFSSELGFGAQRVFYTMALIGGIITLFLWLARRRDKVMFWYSVACLTWGLVSIPRLALRWSESFEPLIPILTWFLNYGLVVPLVILCLRTVNLKRPLFEAALWIFLAVEVSYPFWRPADEGLLRLAWDIANSGLLLAGVGFLVMYAQRPLRWSVIVQIVALLLMAVLMSFEVLRYLDWVYVDFRSVRHYHVPLMLLAMGAAILENHVLAVRRTEQANLELERQVTEIAREIEANQVRLESAMRERALASERQRILTDMHEGLGTSLTGLLRYVQSTRPDRPGIERRIEEALQEMRVAVDALQPREGDLASVLGNLRYRLEGMMRATTIRLVWQVGELPPIAGLSPSTVFAVQRILLEAITNVLKHAGASHITFAACSQGENAIAISVEDDGRGFDPLHPAAGLGLASMRARAAGIGGTLEIRSRPGKGTMVKLVLPTDLAGSAASSLSGAPGADPPQLVAA